MSILPSSKTLILQKINELMSQDLYEIIYESLGKKTLNNAIVLEHKISFSVILSSNNIPLPTPTETPTNTPTPTETPTNTPTPTETPTNTPTPTETPTNTPTPTETPTNTPTPTAPPNSITSLGDGVTTIHEDTIQKVSAVTLNPDVEIYFYNNWDQISILFASTLVYVLGTLVANISHTTDRIGQTVGIKLTPSGPTYFGTLTNNGTINL